MTALEVACGFCAAQPGEPCTPPVDPILRVHAERIEAASIIGADEAQTAGEKAFVPSKTQFNQAVLATGDV